ncbi:hypothetical protein SDRG_14356 [Saprolegnia diclina VS20]|uniref:EF-hand domain-containing protein n=2 Tax=Saprolegnia TaxID=4769 RepID=A0A067CQ74_SAPPC|nr:hypothetical protein SDRG_14356 [Saprolegnia diclina VS20]XP_012197997.1 hypothetical protein SPRG_04017 [Saprolegnia parasitica CBS 223.65]EQC27772.1 hypothetical protein SDRG_14356 [Saprolegnia diclina VS20]KDO31400.1 hypothetical protein SPRG_04017 [Saprolegnia parasitica CBS 223.65]|eukprot:XP_008618702.1 hypothetical protein SDRG_14356 [Saprolegnia diclina VS20]
MALSLEHEQELRKVFDDYDEDGTGDIDAEELGKIAEDLGEPLSKEELEYLIMEFDADGSGTIDWEEFIAWWKVPF